MGVNLDRTYEVIDKLNRAVTSLDICNALTGFTGRYGLTCMIAGTLPSPKERMQEQHLLVSAYPAGWMDRYLDQDYVRVDPVARRIGRNLSPFLWPPEFAESKHCALAKRMFDEAAEFNLRAGFAVPLITLDGAIAAVSLGGEAVEMPPEAHAMIGMISTFAIARAIDLRKGGGGRERPQLTPREIECLKWAADGKTEWEISAILHVSEHTADKHLANAHRKLGAANRVQAVAVAIRWGLIS
jgi:LuxR family transcriptional regulator, quorum-sensing system regulator BjaR1